MKLPDIPKVTNSFMRTLAQLGIDEIQHDASKGKFQNGAKNKSYTSRTYKRYKRNSMTGIRTGKKLKGFGNQSTDTQTSFVNMKLTGRTFRGMRAGSKKDTAIITYDRGEIVLGNRKRGYDIYDLSKENKELILEDLEALYSQRIKKYVSKDIIIK
jgi:hypothetical protein|tara:strand:+ start:355 stop:822 length:468 start_codon:yes stop_codon:yes gene_type:complete